MLAQGVLPNPIFSHFSQFRQFRTRLRESKCKYSGAIVKCEHNRQGDAPLPLHLPLPQFQSKESFNYYTRSCAKYVATPASRAKVTVKASVTEAVGVTESGKFSLSDSALQQRGFELFYTVEFLDLDQLNTLFVKVGFPRRQKEKLARALEHTLSMVWLRDVKAEQLIAFARATGDDVFNAIIWDVVVDPSYQGCGLGKVVIERLMADLVKKGISNIALYAEPNVVGFYKPLGFIADPDGIRAMAYSRRKR
ncbi:unnamed protein product [Calypogeia fissa]